MNISVGYIRCSSDEQTKDSVPRQKNEIEQWAHLNGYTIIKFFTDDGVSGTKPLDERPAGSRLLDEIQKNKAIRYVIIWEYSRIGREADAEQNYYWELHLHRFGVKLISLDNPELTFKPAMERGITRFVQRQTSTQENKTKSLRSYSGGKRNIELGYLNTNVPPYGYARAAKNLSTSEIRILIKGERIQKSFEKPFLTIQKEEAKVIKRVFTLRSTGYSIRSIAQMLNRENIPSAKGKLWRKNVLDRIIRNPVYYGAACWNKTTSSRILAYEKGNDIPRNVQRYGRQNSFNEWIINEDAGLPAIISKELWTTANSFRTTDSKPRGKSSTSRYLLSGLVSCKKSGSRMVGSDGGHYKRKDNTVRKKRYYINNNYHSQGILDGIRSVDADILENIIINAISDNVTAKEIVNRLEKRWVNHLQTQQEHKSGRSEAQRINQEMMEKDQVIKKLCGAIETEPDIISLLPVLKRVENEKKMLEDQRQKLLKQSKITHASYSLRDLGKLVSKYILDFKNQLPNLQIEDQKRLVRQWVHQIEVFEDAGRKKGRAFINILPKVAEFQQYNTVLSGPCRT